ncbi:RNA-directed DNA polymerase, eukaryota, reverse transcriptase zinc-binding domain protein [Tanacetum coccineum]
MVKDFRPISLIGSLYKIIVKLLANRLVTIVGDLVNEVQSAFIANRQILDGPFILNEIIYWCKARKKQSMIFKVDFEKAFDSVRWDFLDDILKNFGFGTRWRNWIQSCLKSSRGSILVNGSPTSEFQFYKGLKHGDPLSPLLFILVMESLHLSFHNVVTAGLFNDDAANKIGCRAIKLPFSYLGINIGDHMSRIKAWDNVINKVLCQLFKWKMKSLSIESIRSHFFNGVDPNVRKMKFVKWNNVLASKEKGGLGVPSFYGLNRALIFKWIWQFRSQNNSLWSRVIKALHGVDDMLGSKPCCSSNWLEIIQVIPSLYYKCIDLLGYMKKSWVMTDKSISVASKLAHSSVCYSLRRNPGGGIEHVQMEGLNSYLEGTILSSMIDRWRWTLLGDGEFSMSSVRCLIDDKTLATVGSKTR